MWPLCGDIPSRALDQLQHLPTDRYPSLAVIADQLAETDLDARFRFALEVLLDGLERRSSP
jgi:hypothetical protein